MSCLVPMSKQQPPGNPTRLGAIRPDRQHLFHHVSALFLSISPSFLGSRIVSTIFFSFLRTPAPSPPDTSATRAPLLPNLRRRRSNGFNPSVTERELRGTLRRTDGPVARHSRRPLNTEGCAWQRAAREQGGAAGQAVIQLRGHRGHGAHHDNCRSSAYHPHKGQKASPSRHPDQRGQLLEVVAVALAIREAPPDAREAAASIGYRRELGRERRGPPAEPTSPRALGTSSWSRIKK